MWFYFSSFFLGVILLFSQKIIAQTTYAVYWSMQTHTPTAVTGSIFQVSEVTPGNNFGNTQFLNGSSSSSGAYPGASGELNASLAARTGPLNKGANGSAYLSFSLNAAPGYKLSLSSFQVAIRSTPTGPQNYSLYSNADAFSAPLLNQSISPNGVWHFVQLPLIGLQPKSSLEFRLYGYNGVGVAAINVANWRLDDLRVEGTIIPESLPVLWQYTTISSFPEFVKLEWGTTAEENSKGFAILRSQTGSNYTQIGFIPSTMSNEMGFTNRYQFIDSFPPAGPLFYKLLQIDWGGKINEGLIRYCYREFPAATSTLTNFKTTSTSINFSYSFIGEASFYLYTVGGVFLGRTNRFSNFKQDVAVQIEIARGELKSGTYLLLVQQKGRIFSKKITVIK
jgi:hypothetical protein